MAQRALFEEIFDGPKSLFGQIFGSSSVRLRAEKRPAAVPNIIIKLTKKQLERLLAGKTETFQGGGHSILLRYENQ